LKISITGVYTIPMGGDLGGLGGRPPPKELRWGTTHAFVLPIFGEVVLSEVRKEKNGNFLLVK